MVQVKTMQSGVQQKANNPALVDSLISQGASKDYAVNKLIAQWCGKTESSGFG